MLKYKKFGGLFYSAWTSYEQDKKHQEHFEVTVKKYPHYYDDLGYLLKNSSFDEDEGFDKDFNLYFNEQRDLLSKCFMNQGLFIAGTVLKICALPGSNGHEKHGDKIRTYIVGGTPGCIGEIDEFPEIYDDDFEYKVSKVELITKKSLGRAMTKKLKEISRMTSWEHFYKYYLERTTDGHKKIIQGFYYNKETFLSGSVTEYEVIQIVEERLWNL